MYTVGDGFFDSSRNTDMRTNEHSQPWGAGGEGHGFCFFLFFRFALSAGLLDYLLIALPV